MGVIACSSCRQQDFTRLCIMIKTKALEVNTFIQSLGSLLWNNQLFQFIHFVWIVNVIICYCTFSENPTLRYSLCLCDEEKEFIEQRTEKAMDAMKDLLGDKAPETPVEVIMVENIWFWYLVKCWEMWKLAWENVNFRWMVKCWEHLKFRLGNSEV